MLQSGDCTKKSIPLTAESLGNVAAKRNPIHTQNCGTLKIATPDIEKRLTIEKILLKIKDREKSKQKLGTNTN